MGLKGNKLLGEAKSFRDQLLAYIVSFLEDVAGNTDPASGGLATESTLSSVNQGLADGLGGNGTFYVNVASGAITGETYKYIVVNEDAVFSVLADNDGVPNDLLVDLGIGGNKITKGMIIRAENNNLIASITLTEGSVIGVK